MINHIKPALLMLLFFTLITGIAYPLLVTVTTQLIFPKQANGSLIGGEQPVGSELIGQTFTSPGYFWGRPSATSPSAYNAGASSGSNQGPNNPALVEAVTGRIKALRDADPGNKKTVPVDLVTASGSGLDPHISPAAAEYQLARVAKARNIALEKLQTLLESHIEARQLGVLGEPRVNVLMLNRALDAL